MKGINRVVIVVKDIEKASKLYSGLLGVKFHDAGVVDRFGVRAMLSWEAGIELVSPTTSKGDVASFMKKNGEGIYAVVFNVDDADQAAERARALGVRIKDTIEMSQSPAFNKFKELLLDQEDTHGAFILLGQIEMK
jgi:4-hydroxyphenylpyruvate dioxygenase-like putative hemolysin